jgi:putative transposase
MVLPESPVPNLSAFIATVKRPCSARVKRDLVTADSSLLEQLTVRERPGKTAYRFWQEGPGYDRNLQDENSVLAAIDYIHNNPVRRGLCTCAIDWFWSSAKFFATEPPLQHSKLPHLMRLPSELFMNATVL